LRGGGPIAIRISHLEDIPYGFVLAVHWPKGKILKNVSFARHVLYVAKQIRGKVLVVDDMVETGKSMTETLQKLTNRFSKWRWVGWQNGFYKKVCQITEIKTAVLHYKTCSGFRPDYVPGKEIAPDGQGQYPWLEYPWENKKILLEGIEYRHVNSEGQVIS
jgi:hypoxanthine phosphoribosyltransferase